MPQVREFLHLTSAPSRALSHPMAERSDVFPGQTGISLETAAVTSTVSIPSIALKQFTEYELRYVMPLSAVESEVDLSRFPRSELTQHYFTRDHIPSLRLLAADILDIPPSMLDDVHITSARVRRTARRLANGMEMPTIYSLDLKGPKGPPEAPGRAEISVPLDRARYERLLAIADNGVISKLRYTIEGAVYPPGRSRRAEIPCKAEIDLLQYCGDGKNPKQPPCERYNFATIDLEVHSPSALKYALKGRHSFEFLENGALEVGSLPGKMQAAFSTRRMAKTGVDDELLKSLKRLHQRWSE